MFTEDRMPRLSSGGGQVLSMTVKRICLVMPLRRPVRSTSDARNVAIGFTLALIEPYRYAVM